jgi:hypothetical protein
MIRLAYWLLRPNVHPLRNRRNRPFRSHLCLLIRLKHVLQFLRLLFGNHQPADQ